ncbi:MAG: CPBP family intramembrane metalloprotease, partial [Acidobacteriota bacterium]|nr:CPBP family intramembrane metalloprotease [Acidobacteriota bacterium]
MNAPAQTNPAKLDPERLRLLVRVGVFVLLAVLGQFIFPRLMQPFGGLLVVSALSAFATGALANAVMARGWEHGQLADFGLAWGPASAREFVIGVAGGAGGAIAITIVALLAGMARFDAVPVAPRAWAGIPLLAIVLLFGSVGEELMFHGYAFQHLVRHMGEFATVLPVGILFGLMHMGNQNVTFLAVVNTMAWGVLLGCAYLRTRALWLPMGMHYGWNLAMPFLGENLSGFTMGVT